MAEVLTFQKVEGLGNDFLLVDWRQRDDPERALRELERVAPRLCDRRRGVGSDGILVITAPSDPSCDAAMVVVNHDGSRPEMCGNGLRCVALYLHLKGGLSPEMMIETGAGPLRCECLGTERSSGEIRVAMGRATDLGEREPEAAAGRVFRAISTGNPHAIAFVGRDEDPEALARSLGPSIETDPLFPARTNVEFAKVEANASITLWVWERGCGITEACGTGACATVAAALRSGLVPADAPVRVRLPGGWLTIEAPSDPEKSVIMSGPARLVFRGEVTLPARAPPEALP